MLTLVRAIEMTTIIIIIILQRGIRKKHNQFAVLLVTSVRHKLVSSWTLTSCQLHWVTS